MMRFVKRLRPLVLVAGLLGLGGVAAPAQAAVIVTLEIPDANLFFGDIFIQATLPDPVPSATLTSFDIATTSTGNPITSFTFSRETGIDCDLGFMSFIEGPCAVVEYNTPSSFSGVGSIAFATSDPDVFTLASGGTLSFREAAVPAPAPASALLLAGALVGFAVMRRRPAA